MASTTDALGRQRTRPEPEQHACHWPTTTPRPDAPNRVPSSWSGSILLIPESQLCLPSYAGALLPCLVPLLVRQALQRGEMRGRFSGRGEPRTHPGTHVCTQHGALHGGRRPRKGAGPLCPTSSVVCLAPAGACGHMPTPAKPENKAFTQRDQVNARIWLGRGGGGRGSGGAFGLWGPGAEGGKGGGR